MLGDLVHIPVAFVAASILIELTPGPNMTYLAITSATHGRRAGMAMVAGITLGLAVLGLLAALGVGSLIEHSAVAYESLRWAGVLYLLWLAWDGWSAADNAELPSAALEASTFFRRGLVTNLLNPKAMAFYVATIPLFAGGGVAAPSRIASFTAAYLLIATAVHVAIVMLSVRAGALLQDAAKKRLVSRFLSLLLAGVALWFAASTAR